MNPAEPNSRHSNEPTSSVVREEHIEYGFIGKLQGLKYEYRRDIHDRARWKPTSARNLMH